MSCITRSSGILLPITSLPSPYGIGTLGKEAYRFVDFLQSSGQTYWQLLPLGPTSFGDSPYSSFSSYAGNPYMIDLDMLVQEKLLKKSEIAVLNWGENPSFVDYAAVYENRFHVLRIAYERGYSLLERECNAFREENKWVETYALFMGLKNHFDMHAWTEWQDEGIRLYREEAVEKYRAELKDEILFYVFIQFLFFRQWEALKAYAHGKGISFIGDLPIYVALDSADVWSEPQFFQLNEQHLPIKVAGVPPDDFTEDGQLWGNPLYDWRRMQEDGYGWWIRRIDGARKLYDVIRIDHFRGLESYWSVPYGDATAKNGKWIKGPGADFINTIRAWFPGIQIIAEDLGYLTPEVQKMREDSTFPGMKVIEFAFDSSMESDYLPHNCTGNSVCYLGTHDNDTVKGWVSSLSRADRELVSEYIHYTKEEGWNQGLIRTGMATGSKLFIMQMQDILELGKEARMNTPGTASGNWQWRVLPGQYNVKLARRLAHLVKIYGRSRKETQTIE